MESCRFFPYSWHVDDEEQEITCIRIYGIDEKNANVCVRIDNFTPYVYIELPDRIKWNTGNAQLVGNKLDELLKEQKPLKKVLMMKKRLYGAHIDANGSEKLFPYLFCSFSARKDIKTLGFKLRSSINVVSLGALKLKMHESDADCILQLTCCRKISTAGWIEFHGKRQEEDDKLTLCDHEFKVKWKNICPFESNLVPCPKIMGFDIEVNSSNPSAMPKPDKPGDKVFQISCVITRYGESQDKYEKYLLTLGQPDQHIVGEDVLIYMYETEADLLTGFTQFIRDENPNLIVGYNILGFDIPYMIDRAKLNMCIFNFDQQGFHKYAHAKERTIKWSSSAYKNQEFSFLDAEGRVYVDLLPLVKRDFKFSNYKLKTIAEHFIGETKDPLSVKGIFKCYRIGITKNKDGEYSKKAQKAMGIVGKYCFCEGTQISLIHGTISIEQMVNGNNTLLSWDEKTDTIGISEQLKFFNNGVQECIELELEDGRKITCTPDHLIANEKGEWIKSEDSLGIRIKVGPILPNIGIDTKDMIMCRIIGYLWTTDIDMCIQKNRCLIYVDSLMDVNIIGKDIETLCGVLPIIERDKHCYIITIPLLLADKIRKTSCVECGLPDITSWNQNCIKEFLGGLFGGSGSCPSLTKETFTEIGIINYGNSEENIVNYMNIIVDCLKKFNIISYYRVNQKITNDESVFIGTLTVPKESLEAFVTTIGYRYCYHKTLKSTVAVMYYRIANTYSEDASKFIEMIGANCIYDKEPVFSLNVIRIKKVGKKQVYDIEVKDTHSYMAEGLVVHNCVQDSALTVMLMDKLQTWTGLTEMAATCCVPIFTLYTQGQQIKVYSQMYKYCMYENIVVEKDAYQVSETERYVGAHVFPPVPGQYNKVIPFDFASLYPTTIIAYNIDYHTWVSDDSDIPDEKCHVMQWEDHIGCEHDPKVIRKMQLNKVIEIEHEKIKKLRDKKNKTTDKFRKKELGDEIQILVDELKPYVKERSDLNKSKPKFPMCAKRYYRFLKEPRGVLPTIIQNLLDARAHTRNVDMVKTKKKISELETNGKNNTSEIESLNSLLGVLDKRQLAYKVSANSMYGAMGVRRGYLPFMPGAMCTTYMGRKNIEITADTIVKKFGGELVYGDTDSNYINFPLMEGKSDEELWKYSEFVADELTKLFPPPIKLEFEGAIYTFFFILTKKRYMYRKVEQKRGKLIYSDSIGKKGVLLARRDNSNFVRVVYEGVINHIADKTPREDVIFWVLEQINKMFSGCNPYTDFVVTKAVGNSVIPEKEEDVMIITSEKGVRKAKIGDYTVKLLSSDPTERKEQLKQKEADNFQEYYLLSLPAQVQLAERMQRRGQRVDAGTRLEYLITDPDRHTAKQYEKVECAEYYSKHSTILELDYFYYLKALANPLDQVLSVAYPGLVDFVLEQYKFRYKVRRNLLNELTELFTPKLKFID
uniref:DNA-directed DNA polymerase n=1 Tax=viral metagenome TaxID=1070528 RepID=A0A6C0H439_9ZZZZ